jgi:nicotinate phosphoribosyltransferase
MYPFAKQVFRQKSADGKFCGDMVVRAGESAPGEPLLVPVLEKGRLVQPPQGLKAVQKHCADQIGCLGEKLLSLEKAASYPVQVSNTLQQESQKVSRK